MTSTAHHPLRQAWEDDPLSYIARACVAEALGAQADDPDFSDLLGRTRFRDRVTRLVYQHFELSIPSSIDPVPTTDLAVLATPASRYHELIRHAGAICHAPSIAGCIDAASVREIRSEIGTSAWRAALKAPTDHAKPANRVSVQTDNIAELVALIDRDGYRAAAAWFDTQPRAIQRWLSVGLFHQADPERPANRNVSDSAAYVAAFQHAASILACDNTPEAVS